MNPSSILNLARYQGHILPAVQVVWIDGQGRVKTSKRLNKVPTQLEDQRLMMTTDGSVFRVDTRKIGVWERCSFRPNTSRPTRISSERDERRRMTRELEQQLVNKMPLKPWKKEALVRGPVQRSRTMTFDWQNPVLRPVLPETGARSKTKPLGHTLPRQGSEAKKQLGTAPKVNWGTPAKPRPGGRSAKGKGTQSIGGPSGEGATLPTHNCSAPRRAIDKGTFMPRLVQVDLRDDLKVLTGAIASMVEAVANLQVRQWAKGEEPTTQSGLSVQPEETTIGDKQPTLVKEDQLGTTTGRALGQDEDQLPLGGLTDCTQDARLQMVEISPARREPGSSSPPAPRTLGAGVRDESAQDPQQC